MPKRPPKNSTPWELKCNYNSRQEGVYYSGGGRIQGSCAPPPTLRRLTPPVRETLSTADLQLPLPKRCPLTPPSNLPTALLQFRLPVRAPVPRCRKGKRFSSFSKDFIKSSFKVFSRPVLFEQAFYFQHSPLAKSPYA